MKNEYTSEKEMIGCRHGNRGEKEEKLGLLARGGSDQNKGRRQLRGLALTA